MKKLLIICILLVPSVASADEWFTWDKTNTRLHVPLTILMIADYGQTIYARDSYWNGCETYEQNKVLGKLPSRGEIQSYFLASYALTTFIAYALPDKYSHGFQAGIITIEAYVVNHNYSAGISVKF